MREIKPHITRRWHWRAFQISNRSTLREVAEKWIKGEIFRSKKSLSDLMGEGGGSSCYWYGVTWGSGGGPGRGKIEAFVRKNNIEQREIFSIAELYREIINEKRNPKLF